jgi:hypothetical protein
MSSYSHEKSADKLFSLISPGQTRKESRQMEHIHGHL